MATLQLGNKTLFTQSGSADPVMSSDVIMPSGSIIQVQYTQFTGRAKMTNVDSNIRYVLCDGTAGSGTEILNVNITPRSSNSKIWLQVSWCGEFGNEIDRYNSVFFLYRDTTVLHNQSEPSEPRSGIMPPSITFEVDDNTTMESCFFQYFDVPNTTSQITYKVGYVGGNSGDVHTNSTVDLRNELGISSISAMEIAA